MHMETKKHLRRIPAIAAALAVGCTLPFLLGNANLPQDNADEAARHSLVQTPELPAQVSFAGQAVALDRYDLRERFDRELTAFCYLHSTTLLILKRANRYFPVVEPILRENGIPDDFKYLMAIESNLDLQARSPRGAAGPWQFMEATGRQFGLEVNRNIDERYHLEKATRAACKYLRQAYGKYHDWVSVAASYNAGQHRISTSLANQGEDTALDLWLNSETSRYMFRILALKTVFTHPARYGFRLRAENLYPPFRYRDTTFQVAIPDLVAFAKEQGVSYYQLKDANPWLRGTHLENKSGRTYTVKIPLRESVWYDPARTPVHDPAWVQP